MKKSAILIKTSDEGSIAMIVPDFTKKNVLKAISENIGINVENMDQLSASSSYGMYIIKKDTFTNRIVPVVENKDSEDLFIFCVEYIKVIEN